MQIRSRLENDKGGPPQNRLRGGSLREALEKAGPAGPPLVEVDEPTRAAATERFLRHVAPVDDVALTRRRATPPDTAPAEPGAEEEADLGTAEATLARRRSKEPLPPWLRAKRRANWRTRLVNGAAWVATLIFTGGMIAGTGYLVAGQHGLLHAVGPATSRSR